MDTDWKGSPAGIQSITLIETLDGVEQSRTELPYTEKEASETSNYVYEIKRDFMIPAGSTMELLVEVVDEKKLRHRAIAERCEVSADGDRGDGEGPEWWRGAEAAIYDADGTLLYEIEPRY